jgi:uncharacterized protein YfiM (DUF2279 family)
MNELARAVLVALGLLAPERPNALAIDRYHVDAFEVRGVQLELRTQKPAPGPPADAWLGEDKFRHFWASYVATAFGFAAAVAADQERDTALLIGIGTGATAGIAKELSDSRRTFFSTRDLVADALGITAAYFLLREVR